MRTIDLIDPVASAFTAGLRKRGERRLILMFILILLSAATSSYATVGLHTPLSPSDGAASDQFGYALSQTNNWLAVGAPGKTVNGADKQGAVYLFTKIGNRWQQAAELTAADGAVNDDFGSAVSLSGGILAVGAFKKVVNGNYNSGAVYIFTQTAQGWQQTAELTAADSDSGDSFGFSLSLNGDALAIGAPGKVVNGNYPSGAVYIFTQTAQGWGQTAELTAADGEDVDNFGVSLSLSGDVLAVGALGKSVNTNSYQGVVYLFTQTAQGWGQTAELTAADGEAFDHFGASLSLNGAALAVGAPEKHFSVALGAEGAAYLFTRNAAGWQQTTELTSEGAQTPSSELSELNFGISLSLSNNALAVGSFLPLFPGDGIRGVGLVHLFSRTSSGWKQTAELEAADGDFAFPLNLNGKTLAVSGDALNAGGGSAVYTTALPAPRSDFNGDGQSDILWRNTQTGDVTYWLMNGTDYTGQWGVVWRGIPTEWQIVGTPDLNGDGSPDILWQNTQTGDVLYWLMNGPSYTGQWGYVWQGIPLQWKIVGTPDLNDDGSPDILWQNTQTGDILYWLMNGPSYTGQWGYVWQGIPTEWQIVGTPDLNNDGSPDILWQNSQTGDVLYWLMNGTDYTGEWGYVWRGIPTEWQIVGTPDLDGDGSPDILWQNTQTGDVLYWLLDGVQYSGRSGIVTTTVPPEWRVVSSH